MPMKVVGDRVLVRVIDDSADSTDSSTPDTNSKKPLEGRVLSVGKGKVLDDGTVQPMDIKLGDRVLFLKGAGTEVKIEGESHIILKGEEVLGVIDS